MALIVATGAGEANADVYASLATINAYATSRGLAFAITDDDEPLAEAAARRAAVWLDGTYRGRFPGRKTNGRAQAREWPRINAYDQQCPPEYIESDEIPQEIIDAFCEAAVREKASPGALSPDVTLAGVVKRERVDGAVEVEYASQGVSVASQRPIATVVDDILGSLLGPRSSGLFGRAERA
jgi:hypothetical protein